MQNTILVTGANGQLGKELQLLAPFYNQYNFLFVGHNELDISKKEVVDVFFEQHKPAIVVNCAAYTQVDKAETDTVQAQKVNVMGVSNLAQNCNSLGSLLVHISTDFVFNGQQNTPYKETAATNPVGVYAKSKWQGEQVAFQHNKYKTIVIRTSWLYSQFGNNFVKTMLRLGKERAEVNVVYDQVGSPTAAADLAAAILYLIQQPHNIRTGVYHYANKGVASWYDLACDVMQAAGYDCVVNPIFTKDYPTPATRPAYSVLATEKISADFGVRIPHWRSSFLKVLAQLLKN